MDDLTLPQGNIHDLQRAMSELPQAEGMITTHHFSGGMYLRKLFRKAGTTIVGKVHLKDHFFMCMLGEIAVSSGDGNWATLKAGDVIASKPGTKRITVALTDAIGVTIHKTELTDISEIERELIEEDELALFDSDNQLKLDVPKFRELTSQVIADEIPGFWSDWTEEQQQLYTDGKWKEFSISRGYSEEAIEKYQQWMDMIAEAKANGLNPFTFIKDLATEAALKNIALDKNGEIMKSSHAPFESRKIMD